MATTYYGYEAEVDYSPAKIAERALAGIEDYFNGIDYSGSNKASGQPSR